jgi:hypothetical protein
VESDFESLALILAIYLIIAALVATTPTGTTSITNRPFRFDFTPWYQADSLYAKRREKKVPSSVQVLGNRPSRKTPWY